MNIAIKQVKAWREQIDATHLIVFAVGRDGTQHVATHGETERNAKEACKFGNDLKSVLKWPRELCNANPLQRICKNCSYYKPDYGIHCFNGWSDDGSRGKCLYQSDRRIETTADDKCADFEPKI